LIGSSRLRQSAEGKLGEGRLRAMRGGFVAPLFGML